MTPTTVIRCWAGLDLLVTGLLALPPTALWFIATLYQFNGLLGEAASPPPFAPVHLLFVCLMGTLGVLWAVIRLLRPEPIHGRADAWARLWVAGLIAYFIFGAGAPMILTAFIATEALGSLHQFWALRPGQDN